MPSIAGLHIANELRRFRRAKLTRLTVIAVILIPLLYSALYLWAFWNPLNKTEALPVALVNSDRGATLDGQETRAGDQVVQGLHDNKKINWTEVSAQEAEDGVKSGKYYFALELPSDFSAAVTSAAGDDAHKARLIATYNDANGYLSTVIGQNVMREVLNTVGTTISSEAVDKVLVGVLDAGSGISQAADGSGRLADGLTQMADQVPQLTSGMDRLKDGSSTLADGTGQLNDQVGQLNQLVEAGPRLADGIQQLGDGATELSGGIHTLTGQLGQVTDLQGGSADTLRQIAGDLRALNLPASTQAADRLERTATALDAQGLGPQSQNASDLERLGEGADQLAYELSDPSAEFRGGIDQLTSSTGRLTQLIDGVGRLNDGAHQLDEGIGTAQGQLPQLVDGVGRLKAGATELHDRLADGAGSVPTWNDGQRVAAASTIGGPVQLTARDDSAGSSFGTGLAPFFLSLAMFIGGIVVFQIFKPLQQRAIAAGVGSFRAALDGYLPVALLGAGQALVMVAVSCLAVGLRPVNVVGFTLVAVLVSLAFMAMCQALVALLGSGPGRVACLVVLMVMMVSSGGIYPVETQNRLIGAVHRFDPMTYAVNALRQMLYGFHDGRLWTGVAVLVVTLLVSLGISAVAARTQRNWSMKRLHPVLPA